MSPKQNLKLLTAIREMNMRQRDFALLVGDNSSIVSMVINGWFNLDDRRQRRYARVLGKEVKELFED